MKMMSSGKMKIIELENPDRLNAFLWFGSFSNSTYALSAKIDVTPLIKHLKKSGGKFYEHMLFLCVLGLNKVAPLRQRISDGKIVEYETPAPSVTVAAPDGNFRIYNAEWNDDPNIFCPSVRKGIEQVSRGGSNKEFGDKNNGVYYFTCLPHLDFTHMSDPIPDDRENQTIPRICWGKYVKNGRKIEMNLNITVSHALVDGKPLSDAFANIQQAVNDCKSIFKGEKDE